jgi:hypothetical protein
VHAFVNTRPGTYTSIVEKQTSYNESGSASEAPYSDKYMSFRFELDYRVDFLNSIRTIFDFCKTCGRKLLNLQ